MVFLAILIALLVEQARPLARGNAVHAGMRGWVRGMVKHLDAGAPGHAWLAWAAAVVFPALVAAAIHMLLMVWLGFLGAACWSVAVLYATLGFRQFSHRFTTIRDALEDADEDTARRLLADWQQADIGRLPRTEILRQVIEHSVLSAHRHVFGVLAWFAVFALLGLGPLGAVFYRLAEFVPRYWSHQSSHLAVPISPSLLVFAQRAWHWVDWLPARLTALAFAVVGSFEDAVEGWRSAAQRFGGQLQNDQVILAAAAGAMGVRLGFGTGGPLPDAEGAPGPFVSQADPAPGHLKSVVGLVWRSVVLWMVMLALVGLGR